MTELPAVHDSVEPMTITTTISVDDEGASSRAGEFVYVEDDPDVFATTDPDVIVDLTDAFDGTHTADEIAAQAIAEWIDVFCWYAIDSGSMGDGDTLQANLRDRPALYGAFVGFARAHLLDADTEIADGRENVYREFRAAVEGFSPDDRVCDRASSDVFTRAKTVESEANADASTDSDQDGEDDLDIEPAAETVEHLSECDPVWQRQYDDIITNDDEQVYVRTGDTIQAIEISTGDLAWETPVRGGCARLRHPHSPVGSMLCLRREADIVALDTATGERRATITIEERISSWALLDDDRLALVHAEPDRRERAPFVDAPDEEAYVSRGYGSPTLSVYSLVTGERLAAHDDLEIRRIDGHIADTLFFHEYEGNRLTAIDATTGDHAWTAQFETGIVDVAYVRDRADEAVVACATGAGNVYGLSPASGRREWASSPPVARPPEEMRRHARRADIDEAWGTQSGDKPIRFVDTHETGTLYLVDRAQGTYASLDPETGRERWRYRPAVDATDFPPDFAAVADDTLYLAETVAHDEYFAPPTRFRAIDTAAGTERWETVVENRASAVDGLTVSDERLIAGQFQATMVLSRETGAYQLYVGVRHDELRPATVDDGVLVAGDETTLYGIATEVFEG